MTTNKIAIVEMVSVEVVSVWTVYPDQSSP